MKVAHGFRDLQNYTTLKPINRYEVLEDGFRDLQNYTTLKRQWSNYKD